MQSRLPVAALFALLVTTWLGAHAQPNDDEGGLLGRAVGAQAAAELYERALIDYNLGKVRTAYVYLRSALREDPLMLPAHLLLSKIYLSLGQGEQAEQQLLIADGLGAHRALTQNSLARAYLMQGKATELLEKLFPLGSAPEEDAELLVLRGEAHLQLDQIFDAQRAFTQAWEQSPQSASAALGRVQVMLLQGEIDKAIELAQAAVEIAPRNPRAWYLKGLLANAVGDYSGAVSDLDRSVQLQPAYLPAQLLRLDILMRLQRLEAASQAAGDIRETFPNDPRGYLVEAVVRAAQGRTAVANALLEDAATLISRFPQELIEGHPPTLLVAGIVNFNLKRWRLAKSFLETFVNQHPDAVGPRVLLARLALDEERSPEQAIKLLEPALAESPDNPRLLTLLAEAYIRTAQHLRAAEILRRALREDQRNLLLRAQQAVNEYGLGRRTQAIDSLAWVLNQKRQLRQAGVSMVIMLVREGRADEALTSAAEFLAAFPDNLSTLNLYGTVALAAGRTEAVRWAFSLALLLDPSFFPVRQNLAELELREGRLAEAERQAAIIRAQQPRDIPAMLLASRVAQARGQGDLAIEYAREAMGVDPGAVDAAIFLSELLLDRRDVDAATNVLETALARAANQDNDQLMLALGRAQLASGNAGAARVALRRASGLVGYRASLLLVIAALQEEAGDLKGTLWSLRKAVRGEPSSLPARLRLGEALIDQGHFEEAEAVAAELADAYPTEPYADHLRGLLHLATGEAADALHWFEQALAKRSSPLLVVRAYEAKRDLDGVDAANVFLDDWLHAHPEDVVVARTLAQGYFSAGRLREAQALFEQTAEGLPDDPMLLNNMALVYSELGDPRAEDYARRALQRAPGSPEIIDTLGWVLMRAGRPDEGLTYLRQAYARAGADPSIAYHLAATLNTLGRREEALDAVLEALRHDGHFPERGQALRLLDELRAADGADASGSG